MKKCNYCGNEFEPRNPKGKFCSDKCRVYASRKAKPGIKLGDMVVHGIMAFGPNGEKNEIKIEPPIILVKAPKTLDELKALCPPELTGFERSEWIAKERQKYGI